MVESKGRVSLCTGRELLRENIPVEADAVARTAVPYIGTADQPVDLDKAAEKLVIALRKGCIQLSQLIAWMWYEDPQEGPPLIDAPADQQKKLKKLFDAALKYQAFNNKPRGSEAIASMLVPSKGAGDNPNQNAIARLAANSPDLADGPVFDLTDVINPVPTLTLAEVYDKLMPQAGDYVFESIYLANFYAEVITDEYDGSVSFDFFGKDNPTGQSKFIVVIPYPPKPALSELTVTNEELSDWATSLNYSPPNYNPYIPVNGSC
jgi:hypothetical protein